MAGGPPDWLTARPIAHRGRHDAARGVVENSLSAARAAIAGGFAIECDIQRSADGEAVVFHDFELDRLTGSQGPLAARPAAELTALAYRQGSDRIATLAALLGTIAGQVPLICEIKSAFDGDMRLPDRALAIAADYPGPLALKSFDPAVVAHLRAAGARRPLGIVAEAQYDDAEWDGLAPAAKRELAALVHFPQTRPDFLSYAVDDLPHAAPLLCRAALRLPVVSWTVRRPAQRARAARWADQMVFEGFDP